MPLVQHIVIINPMTQHIMTRHVLMLEQLTLVASSYFDEFSDVLMTDRVRLKRQLEK